jgi:hypothetical protein
VLLLLLFSHALMYPFYPVPVVFFAKMAANVERERHQNKKQHQHHWSLATGAWRVLQFPVTKWTRVAGDLTDW